MRNLPWFVCAVLFLQGLSSPMCLGKPPAKRLPASNATSDATDSAVGPIRATSQAFVAAFNQGDAKAIAALWTENGEYIDDAGRRFIGRDEIEKGYAQFFASNPKSKLQIMIDSVRILGDATAIEDGRGVVEPPTAGVPGFSKYTAVHVKVGDRWLMASVRDTHVETPSAFSNVSDLEWLIGTWVAEEHGSKMESSCTWVANKSFVQRSYTVSHTDGSQTAGVQLIGWNSLLGQVQSWNFSPDGGHAIGVWTPHAGGWTARMNGVTGNGDLTTSVNLLTRLDDSAYVWQSVERTLGGVELADTDEIILKRQPAKR